jgi:tripartite-type tricarboxylate transporter receptor subunit TctC
MPFIDGDELGGRGAVVPGEADPHRHPFRRRRLLRHHRARDRLQEAGYPELVVTSWQAAAAPVKTPREVVARLNDAMVKALRSPDIRERMNQIGFDVVASTPEEFGQFMKAEVDRWTKVVERGGTKPD